MGEGEEDDPHQKPEAVGGVERRRTAGSHGGRERRPDQTRPVDKDGIPMPRVARSGDARAPDMESRQHNLGVVLQRGEVRAAAGKVEGT